MVAGWPAYRKRLEGDDGGESDDEEKMNRIEAITPSGRVRTARLLAIAADVVQIALAPLFVGGGFSPINDALDVAMAAAMTYLVGWHWAFLPSFVAELVPGLDLVPTWTAAVFFATRGRGGTVSDAARQGAIDAEVVSSGPASTAPPRG